MCVVCCSVLQCVAVCCSVYSITCESSCMASRHEYIPAMQYAAVCCSVLQCVAVCCSVLQCIFHHLRILLYCFETRVHIGELFENHALVVLQCVAVCCSVLQRDEVCCKCVIDVFSFCENDALVKFSQKSGVLSFYIVKLVAS